MKKKQNLLQSFGNAFRGMYIFFLNDRNGEIHLFAALMAIGLSVALGISASEWLAVLLCTGIVIGFEMMNAAVEKLCDLVQQEYHPIIKAVKDISAAAVLWTSIVSALTGCIIFIPKIIALL